MAGGRQPGGRMQGTGVGENPLIHPLYLVAAPFSTATAGPFRPQRPPRDQGGAAPASFLIHFLIPASSDGFMPSCSPLSASRQAKATSPAFMAMPANGIIFWFAGSIGLSMASRSQR